MRVRAGQWHHQVTGVLSPPCPDRICHPGVNPGSKPSAPAPNPGMELLAPAALLALLVLTLGHPDPTLDRHWELWKKTYGKEYHPQVRKNILGMSQWGAGGVRGIQGLFWNIPGFSGALLGNEHHSGKIQWCFQAGLVPRDDPAGAPSSLYWDELGRDGSGGALTGPCWNSRRIHSDA